LNVLDTS